MNFILDGNYNKELISLIKRENIPVSHVIVHVPQNPIGNSSVFLPKKLPSIDDFKDYTKIIKDHGIIPIAGIDSTCQGNFEAHITQYEAMKSLFESLLELNYKEVLVSSPNNIGFIKEQLPSMKIYLSYSQYVTSLNRGRIFFNLGAKSIILHPDINRSFNALKNFQKLKDDINSNEIEYILPLNMGCNWGCIHWYHHHNLQSHRTINSPVLPNQESVSDVENEFDYSILDCWKKRLKDPANFLKTGWISPHNIHLYEDIGYNKFLLFISGYSNEKILKILKSYMSKSLDTNFNEFLNIPQPYGKYWSNEKIQKALIQLSPDVVKKFCEDFPYNIPFPLENEINKFCNKSINQLKFGNIKERDEILELINQKMKQIEKGAIKE